MSLIEQLGGYEKAKKWLDKNGADIEWKHLGYYRRELLEYRRQYNIFEEGDWVVIPSRGNGLFQVSRLLSRSDMLEMIHATDEEIEAGGR